MDSAQALALRKCLEDQVVGGWNIGGFLGNGKSAVVMAARKEERRGAIKIFHPELIERFGKEVQLERIRRETSLIGFRQENLIEILDGGECRKTGFLFIVMEQLDWKNLRDLLPQIPNENIHLIIRDIALAARFLEDRALVHRDIKPENIAINDSYTSAKLLDLGVLRPFGIAGLTDVDARPFIGTLRYSSPEFLRRQEEDSPEGWRAISIYQIGAVLHDLLMKVELFHEYSEPYSILVGAVQEVVPDIHGSDADLVRICKHSLVKSPKTRLELVGWRDFIPDEDGAVEASALREKIRMRQRYYKEVNAENGMPEGEEKRLIRHQLELASNGLDVKTAILLSTLKCFPLHEIKHQIKFEDKCCSSVIKFEKDRRLGLSANIIVQLDLKFLDDNLGSPIYRLNGSFFLSRTEGEEERLIENEEIAVGGLNEVISDSKIEAWMLAVLNRAYEAIDRS
jgi:serine/threonine protein kinase